MIILTSEGAKDWPELTNISIIPNPISTPVEGKQTDILSHNAIAVGRYAPQKGFDMLIPRLEHCRPKTSGLETTYLWRRRPEREVHQTNR